MLPVFQWLAFGAAAGVGYTVASKIVDAGVSAAKTAAQSVGSGDDITKLHDENDEDNNGEGRISLR